MATLNTLRTRGGWIVTAVIGLALLAFLVGDLAGGNGSILGGGQKVGEIDGQSISYLDYARDVEYYSQVQQLFGAGGSTQADQDALREMVWQTTLSDVVVVPGLEKLGIEVGEDEMYDLFYGDNISPLLMNMGVFNDPATGVFDKAAVRNFVTNLPMDQTGGMRTMWDYIQDQVRDESMLRKYFGLVGGMVYVTDLEAEAGTARANTYYNARYVGQPYTAIADSTVAVTSAEVRRYYDERRELYRQEASRDVEYILFEVMPSAQDYSDAKAYVDNLAAEFATAADVAQYATLNTQDAFDPTYYTPAQLPAGLAGYVADAARPAVYGPVLEGDIYTLARVADVRSFPDTVAFRQIALLPGSEALADSLLGALRAGSDFATLAAAHSMIPAEQLDAGRISTQMIPIEIGERIYEGRDRYLTVSNPNAILLLDVYYRGPVSEKVQVGTIRYYVEPSSATQQAAYARASAFVATVGGSREAFNKVAADSVYSKRAARIGASNLQVTGLEQSQELVRWAFNSKPGAVSGIMESDDNYVVATLTGSREAGATPVEDVAPQITAELRREKKADLLAGRMTGAASLDALAGTLSTPVGVADGVNFNSFFIPDLGADPALIGAIGAAPQGQLSRPVKALTGVYVVEITASETRDETDVASQRVRDEAVGQNYLPERAMQAITALSNVVDNRAKYY